MIRNNSYIIPQKDVMRLLACSAGEGHAEVVKLLLKNSKINVNLQDKCNTT